VALVGLLVVGLGGTITAGLVIADDQQSGEDILSDVHEKYNTADSVAGDAVVTVETDESVSEATVGFAAAGDRQARLNVSSGDGYVLTGVNGETAWVYDPVTGLTGVVDRAGEGLTLGLRAGTEEQSLAVSSALTGLGIDANTTVGELRAEFGDQLPAEFDERLANVSNDTTLAELPEDADGELAAAFADGDTEDLPAELNETSLDAFEGERPAELNESTLDALRAELPAEINESTVEAFAGELAAATEGTSLAAFEFDGELPAELNESTAEAFAEEFLTAVANGAFDDFLSEDAADELSSRAAALETGEFDGTTAEEVRTELDEALPEEIDDLGKYESIEALTGDLAAVANETSVQLVGTTTVDGEEAHELLITHPDLDGETRLYTSVETDEILRQVTTTPDATITVDVTDTRFDVSPADSTFEPRGATELANLTAATTTAETPAAIDDATPFPAAVPDDSWTLKRASVVTTSGALSIPGLSLPTESFETTAATAVYTAGERALAVSQRPAPAWLEERTASELTGTDIEATLEAALETEIEFDTAVSIETDAETSVVTIGDREVVLTSTPDGTAAAWVEAGTVVTVAGDFERADLESAIAAITVGVDD